MTKKYSTGRRGAYQAAMAPCPPTGHDSDSNGLKGLAIAALIYIFVKVYNVFPVSPTRKNYMSFLMTLNSSRTWHSMRSIIQVYRPFCQFATWVRITDTVQDAMSSEITVSPVIFWSEYLKRSKKHGSFRTVTTPKVLWYAP